MAKVAELLTQGNATLSALSEIPMRSKNGINWLVSHDVMSVGVPVRLSRSPSIHSNVVQGQVRNSGFGGWAESNQTLTDLMCIAVSVKPIVDRHKTGLRNGSGLHIKSQCLLGLTVQGPTSSITSSINNKNPGYVPTLTTRWCWGAIPTDVCSLNGRTEARN